MVIFSGNHQVNDEIPVPFHTPDYEEMEPTIHGWGSVNNEFCIMYEGRMPE